MDALFYPPLAFLIYLALCALLMRLGQHMAGESADPAQVAHPHKHSHYASGESAAGLENESAPGYRPFFAVALFFAVLHLGVIVLATSNLSFVAVLYLLGLVLVLIALILG